MEGAVTREQAIEHLDLFGYCVLEGLLPANEADRMVARHRQIHQDAAYRSYLQDPDDAAYQTLFGWLNLDATCWPCAAHAEVLAVVRHFLGPGARIGEACSKWLKPGGPQQHMHVDSTEDLPAVLPDLPWMINTLWMLSDFRKENGGTLVVPFSHRLRRRPSPRTLAESPIVSVEGRRGSILLWQGALWHGAGANTTRDEDRIGLNIAYYPPWWNLAREDGHQPVWPEVFARMPAELQALTRHKVGRTRADVYEGG
jgi:ectoine hydroxylase-related dioxygenase (phytanoyl-CoA dioxygenase family)